MVKCKVVVKMKDGTTEEYEGLFESTVTAFEDALDRFGLGNKIDVKALKPNAERNSN